MKQYPDLMSLGRKALACLLFGVSLMCRPGLCLELPESVVMIPKGTGLLSTQLETTIFLPQGTGPFPIVIINHGKASGNPRLQGRFRPLGAARYFLARGYAVVVPMRQGFSKSTGSYIDGGCNVESNGRVAAGDVVATLDYITTQPWADRSHILVIGQSHGGWTTLAFGTHAYAGVKGLVNFAGGLRQDNCTYWQGGLIAAAGAYGAETSLPSLWFYGDNDSYWPTPVWHAMYENYMAKGGKGRLVAFGEFGTDSHSMFHAAAGAPIWEPEITRFLQETGMPSDVLPKFSMYVSRQNIEASGFAAIEEISRLPVQTDEALKAYQHFLAQKPPRAFAVSADGGWGSGWGGNDPQGRAIANCRKRTAFSECLLYAVDGKVVWRPTQ